MVVAAVMGWAVGLLYVIVYAPCIAIALIAMPALALASIRGNGVRVSAAQLPDIHRRVHAATQRLGLAEAPQAWVIQSGGVIESFVTWVLGKNHVVITSGMVDAVARLAPTEGPDELDFLIGRQVGRLAANQIFARLLLLPGTFMPWIGPAWDRAMVYTADRCGHAVTGSVDVSCRALALGATGGRLAANVDLPRLAEQEREASTFWLAVAEINAGQPFLSRRVAALREGVEPGSAPTTPRAWWAYAIAPLFSWYAVFFAYIGVFCCCSPILSVMLAMLEG